jgi:outer membrane receptor protein involved in Fe transport
MKLLALFVFFIITLPVIHAENTWLKVLLKNIDRTPVPGIEIYVLETNTPVITDETGRATIFVPAGKNFLTLRIQSKQYHPLKIKLSLKQNLPLQEIILIPKEHLKEEITVTALNIKGESISSPAAESKVSFLEIKEKIPSTIVQTLQETPGIHMIGSGGYPATPSIRGLARRRVLVLIDGFRLVSDRRVGTSIGFISPELIQRLEVVRSASSTLYGSDAIAGVIQVFTEAANSASESYNVFNLNADSSGKRINPGISINQQLGSFSLHTGFQYTHAENYQSADEEIYHSGYAYNHVSFSLMYNKEGKQLAFRYLGGFGENIGKPSRENNASEYTYNPRDHEQLITLSYNDQSLIKNSMFHAALYFNPTLYELSNVNQPAQSIENANTTCSNYMGKLSLTHTISPCFSWQCGTDCYIRSNLDITNRIEDPAEILTAKPLKKGYRSDVGFYIYGDYSGIPGWNFISGLRYTFFNLQATAEDTFYQRQTDSLSAFLGITKKIGSSLVVFANAGRAFRVPSLSECYYTGITGRKFVIGNPDLLPESSINLDFGIKYYKESVFLGFYGFRNRLNQMIERYRDEHKIYRYDNLDQAGIYGTEFEFQWFMRHNLELFGHFSYYIGKSTVSENPVNDIPAARLFNGIKYIYNKAWIELNSIYNFKKTAVGPAEIPGTDYWLLNIKGGYYLSSKIHLNLKISNLLNKHYYENLDPDIPYAPGIGISSGMHIYF